MVIEVNLQEALATVRALDLPQPRKIELIRRLVDAPTTGVWAVVVAEAKAEATKSYLSNRAEAAELLERRWTEDRLRRAQDALREPYTPTREHVEPWIPSDPARPVTVTWTTPKHPEKVRVESRPELPDSYVCPPEHRHGATGHCYGSHRCKCSDCKDSHRERTRAYRRGESPAQRPRENFFQCPPEHRHGETSTCYKHGCRCISCRDAKRRETARHAERRSQK